MTEHEINCSFCKKSNTEVRQIIAANDKVAICDECIMGCLEVLIYGEPENTVIVLDDEVEEGDLNNGC